MNSAPQWIGDRLYRIEKELLDSREMQAAIAAKLDALGGNGQPGRMGKVEEGLERVTLKVEYLSGKLVAYGSIGIFLLAALEVALRFLR